VSTSPLSSKIRVPVSVKMSASWDTVLGELSQKMAFSIEKPIQKPNIINDEITSSDDSYTIEYYDDFELVDEDMVDEDGEQLQHVETVEEDDYDEYTYDEETVLSAVMEDKDNDADSTAAPPPLPMRTTTNCVNAPKPPTKVPSSPVTQASPITPRHFVKNAPDPPTPSSQRAKAANATGLSELSKQLRILQAKNESQNVDINRLERQLRILADLQGISVTDLRKALEDACASEAFGELQNRVSKLKYELEAATLAKHAELRKNAAAPYIANLELRVGELEEVEDKLMNEIRGLYENFRQEKAKTTRFESENQRLKGALQDMITRAQSETSRAAEAETRFKKQIQELRELQSNIMKEEAKKSRGEPSGAGKQARTNAGNLSGMVSPEMAAEYEHMVQLLKKKDVELQDAKAKLSADDIRRAQSLKDSEERAHKAQMNMKVEADKLALTVKELEDADGQNGLRLAQFKARFTVQNERIVDQGQQLDSLYTAFNLLKEESDSENDRRAAMLTNLEEADAEIARQTHKLEDKGNTENRRKRNHVFPPSPVSGRRTSSSASTPATYGMTPSDITASPGVTTRRPAIATLAPVSPATPVSARIPFSNDRKDRNYDDYNITPNFNHSNDSNTSPNSNNRNGRRYDDCNSTQFSNNTNESSYDYSSETPTIYATAKAFHPTPEKTSSTWDLILGKDRTNPLETPDGSIYKDTGVELICGDLIVESNSMLRKWKTRPSRIYLRGEGYQWKIGDKRSFPLRFGISKVEYHPNYPLAFAVYLDPTSAHAPTIRAAATNEHEYHQWMAALHMATTGEVYQGGGPSDALKTAPAAAPLSPSSRPKTPGSSTRRSSNKGIFSYPRSSSASKRSVPSPSPLVSSAKEIDQDDDLQRILELSKYET